MGLFDLLEEAFEWVVDSFSDSEDHRRVKPQGPPAQSAMSAANHQAFWEKASSLITPEFLAQLARETGLSTLQVSMKMQGPCNEVLQRWQRLARPITDADLEKMRQEIRDQVLQR